MTNIFEELDGKLFQELMLYSELNKKLRDGLVEELSKELYMGLST